jgi:deoxyhypusine synthase
VVIYGDSTIALPLLTAYAVSKAKPRPRRELYAQREVLLKELKEAYETGKAGRP